MVFVTDNPCTPSTTVDASVWPSDKRSTTLAVQYGETQTLQLTGVSNGDCEYSFSNPTLVNSGDSTLFDQFKTPTYTTSPTFTYSDVANKLVASVSGNANFAFEANIASEGLQTGSFDMTTLISFGNMVPGHPGYPLTFTVSIDYCTASFSSADPDVSIF